MFGEIVVFADLLQLQKFPNKGFFQPQINTEAISSHEGFPMNSKCIKLFNTNYLYHIVLTV